jgi:hypothetical protein
LFREPVNEVSELYGLLGAARGSVLRVEVEDDFLSSEVSNGHFSAFV